MQTSVPTLSDPVRPRDALLIIGTFTVGQAIQIDNGVIHPAAIGWLMLAILCFTMAMSPAILARLTILPRIKPISLLIACVAVQWIELLEWDIRWGSKMWATAACMVLSGIGVMLTFRSAKWGLVLIVLGHFFAGAMTIQSTPRPGIDVWYFQDESTAALLRGRDPYAVRFRDIYGPHSGVYAEDMSVNGWLTYSYPYPPLTLITTAPGRFFGDVRWAHLVALELSALLLIAAVGIEIRTVLAMAMLLLCPRSLLVIRAAWTEPMVLLMIAGVIYTACRKPAWVWLSFGLLLAIKQYAILAAPLLLLIYPPRELGKMLAKSILVAACIALPFLIWNPVSFVRSVILWQLRQPFRRDALSLAVLIDRTVGIRPGMALCAVATPAAMVLAIRRSPRNVFGFATALTFVLLIFFATNKQAFCNYYFLVMGIACGGIAIASGCNESHGNVIIKIPNQSEVAA